MINYITFPPIIIYKTYLQWWYSFSLGIIGRIIVIGELMEKDKPIIKPIP